MTAPKTTAIARLEQSAEQRAGSLTVSQRKAFLETASRSDLDKLSDDQRRAALVAFGVHTGLRPELGEVMIYQGRFYVTMLGRIRNAHANALFDGMQARPASRIQKLDAGYEEADVVWLCDTYRKGAARPFRGWGKVTRAEIVKARAGEKSKFTPVAQHPVEMARKRAEYDGLRLAFPIDEQLTEQAARFIAEAEAELARVPPRLALDAGAEVIEDDLADKEAVEQAGATAEPEAKGPPLQLETQS